MIKKILLVLFVLLLLPVTSLADVHPASDCSRAAIWSAISGAHTGDTVAVPPGSCTWNSGEKITIPNDLKITLEGRGIGVTTITGTTAYSNIISLGKSGSRITGFSFVNVSVYFNGVGFRIDHNSFTASTGGIYGLKTDEQANTASEFNAGLIDHNIITNGRIVVFAGPMLNNTDWVLATDLGSADGAVYIEDNTIYKTNNAAANIIDANYGGTYVFRYNTVNGQYIEAHSVQENTANRAAKRWEIYGNTINRNGVTAWSNAMHLRGGTGIVAYNNIDDTTWADYIALDNVRCYQTTSYYGLCDGTRNGVDGNTGEGAEAGYPCRDQIGRGPDDPLWVSPSGTYTQPLEPAYFWMNFNDAGAVNPVIVNSSSNHIKSDRDYYTTASSFNGTSGVGCGTLANRPETCTTGVSYWATDQSCESVSGMVGAEPSTPIDGTLYKCTAKDTWTSYWTPAAYPHELNENSGGDTTAPAVTSVYVNGATMTISFSEEITSADNAAFTLDPSGADVTVDCPEVATGAMSMACTISRALVQSETATYAYTDTKVIDAVSNALANIGTTAITGNLTPAEAPTSKLTVNKTGAGCTVTSSPSGILVSGATASDDFDFNTDTPVTLSGWSENGWNAITYGGDCAANGTVTMSADKTCTATCTQVQLFP
jgi:hypothetical protein